MFETLSKKKDLDIIDILVYINYEFNRLQENLTEIRKEIKTMAIDQATFDTDLAGLISSFGTLVTAVDAFIASHPAADLTPEDQAVRDAAAAVADELNKLNPPTPVPTPAPAPTP